MRSWAFDTTSTSNANELWRYFGPREVLFEANLHGTAPAVSGTVAYAGFPSGFVVALDLASGTELWRRDLGAAILSSPAVSGGTVYVGTHGGRLYGLDVNTGDIVWQFTASSTWVASSWGRQTSTRSPARARPDPAGPLCRARQRIWLMLNVRGSFPIRLSPSTASIVESCSDVRSKPRTSRFSRARAGDVVLGITIRPCCRCQRRMT